MKFIISSSVLSKGLQSIGGVISSHNTLPILDNFLFELKGDSLTVTASDLETTMIVALPVTMSENNGNIAIPAKTLLDYLKHLPDVPVSFRINKDQQSIHMSAGENESNLTGFKGDEYPKIPALEDASSLDLNSNVLAEAISKTLFATGTDEMRPVMSGIYCQLSDSDIIFVATDAHKLVRYKRTDVKADRMLSYILPKKPMNQLRNLLSSIDTPVSIQYNDTNALFSFNNITLICRLIDGKYPNYEAVIPKENPNVIIVDRQVLLLAMKRVSVMASHSTYQVRFSVKGQELVLTSEDVDYSNSAKERLTCNYSGQAMEIGFNSRFLIEMLANIETTEVKIEMSEPNRAALIMPATSDNANEDVLMLIMPIMLNA